MTYSVECFLRRAFRLQRCFVDLKLRIYLSGCGGHVLLHHVDVGRWISWVTIPFPNGRSKGDRFIHVFFHFFRLFKDDELSYLIRTVTCMLTGSLLWSNYWYGCLEQFQSGATTALCKALTTPTKNNDNNVMKWKVIGSLRLGIPCSGGFPWLFPTGLTVACGTNIKAPQPKTDPRNVSIHNTFFIPKKHDAMGQLLLVLLARLGWDGE